MTKDVQKNDREYFDFVPVEKMHNEIIPEDLPEGPYGSPINRDRLGKSTPFQEGQRALSYSQYENRELHEDLPRQGYHNAHEPHDNKKTAKEPPYDDVQ